MRKWMMLQLCGMLVATMGVSAFSAGDDPVNFLPTRADAPYEVYQENTERGRSTLVTSDSVLHSAHILIDYTLRAAELRKLDANVRQLTDIMLARMVAKAEDEARRRYIVAPPPYGYDRVAAYFGVAATLLNPDAKLPELIRPQVEREVALILAHKEQAKSPIMGVLEDYTQYVPRGHYTRNEAFQRYFRAMMWYGRAGFPISGEKEPGVKLSRDEARANAWAGIMLSRNLADADTMKLWNSIMRPTAFLVGQPDDLTPVEYLTLTRQVFGETLPGAWTADVQQKTDEFIARAIALRPPRIVGTVQSDQTNTPPVALRLFGQRYTPDSEIFQRLVHPSVPERFMPSGLDVMAVMHSNLAMQLLTERGEPTRYPQYLPQLRQLQQEWATRSDADWRATAYMLWLRAVRDVVSDAGTPSGKLPAWWNSPRWQAKRVNTGLGSWAELRHDTILYVKQSYTLLRSAVPRPNAQEPVYYVEPVPQVYADISNLLSITKEQLTREGDFPTEMAKNYDEMLGLLISLQRISRQELALDGDTPVADDLQRVKRIGALLRMVETLPEPLRTELTGTEDAKSALIADVHTDPNSGNVLEVGVGRVLIVSVPVESDRGTVTVYGPIYSYYEFTHPMNDRLTDAAWQGMLDAGNAGEPFILGRYFAGR